jgi:hypothetical protein
MPDAAVSMEQQDNVVAGFPTVAATRIASRMQRKGKENKEDFNETPVGRIVETYSVPDRRGRYRSDAALLGTPRLG